MCRKALGAWDKVCEPKGAGGLHLVSLVDWNQATICKLLWNICTKKEKLWVKWLHVYFFKDVTVADYVVPVIALG